MDPRFLIRAEFCELAAVSRLTIGLAGKVSRLILIEFWRRLREGADRGARGWR